MTGKPPISAKNAPFEQARQLKIACQESERPLPPHGFSQMNSISEIDKQSSSLQDDQAFDDLRFVQHERSSAQQFGESADCRALKDTPTAAAGINSERIAGNYVITTQTHRLDDILRVEGLDGYGEEDN